MNRSIIAGVALVAGFAIATPMLAWSADSPPQSEEAAPAHSGMPGVEGMPGMHGMRGGGMRDHEGWRGHHHGWMRGGMMHRMRHLPPQQRCEERLARRAGMIAYTVAKVNLTAEQRPAWDKLNALAQAATDKERQLCATLKPADERGQETLLDRVNRREQFLSARLEGLQQVRPALEQLYQTLTPEQKAIVDHPFKHRDHPFKHR
jgi:LTXXQ motif family protein